MAENDSYEVKFKADDYNPSAILKQLGSDIRSSVSSIFGATELISHEIINDNIQHSLNDIKAAASAALHTSEAIFDLLKLLNDDYEIAEEEYCFEDIILAVRKILEQGASKKSIQVEIDVDPNIPYKMFGDAEKIISILTNVVDGAIRATPEGKKITLAVSGENGMEGRVILRFDVLDSGPGVLDSRIAAAVIEKGRRTDSDPAADFVAMALYTNSRIAAKLGGKIKVKAVPNKGCVFTLTVNQGKVGGETLADRYAMEMEGNDREVPFLVKDARVLVVAYNLGRAAQVRKKLSAYAIQADISDSVKESCSLVDRIGYDLVLVDIHKTSSEGDDAYEKIHEAADESGAAQEAHTKVVYIPEGKKDTQNPELGKLPSYSDIEAILEANIPKEKLAVFELCDYDDEALERLENLGLNVRSALANFSGKEEEYKGVLITTCRSSDTKALMLNHYLEQHDYKNYIITMHGILGVAQVIGADNLAQRARELENAAKQGLRQLLEEKTKSFAAEFDGLLTSIRSAIITQERDINKGMIEKEDLTLIIRELCEYLNDYRVNEAEMLFYSLSQFSFGNDRVMELIHEAEEEMISYNYNEVSNILEEVLSLLNRI